MGFLPRDPLFRDDTKGARPLWNPPSIDGTYPKFLWIFPRLRHKKDIPPSTNRNIHLFDRAAAEASLTDQL